MNARMREELIRVREALRWTDIRTHEVIKPKWKEPTYQELLDRLYSNCKDDIFTKNVFKIKPPVVVRESKKKIVLVNFAQMVDTINRPPEHFLSYILAELSTSGSTDSQGRATIQYANKQAQKHIENVIKEYIKDFIICNVCKSPDTNLNRDSVKRLDYKLCRLCGAGRCVKTIKTGFRVKICKRNKK